MLYHAKDIMKKANRNIVLRTDTVVKNDGMKALIDTLGKVDAKRFISLIQ